VYDGVECSVYQRWEYDGRGRETFAGQSSNGVAQHLRTWYDSADRMQYRDYEGTGEVVTSAYDAAWRPVSLCTNAGPCYASGATYSALNQPLALDVGNTTREQRIYSQPMLRLEWLSIGTSSNVNAYFAGNYSYDAVGNLRTLSNPGWGTQTYSYDHRDRLVGAVSPTAVTFNETYTYDVLGNLTSKTGVGSYSYPAAGQPRPHAPTSVNGQPYSYDANGNLLSGGGRTYAWNGDNQPRQITHQGVTESYSYDADGNRALRHRAGVTTTTFAGHYEQVEGTLRRLYHFNGRVVAQRTGAGTGSVTYLHADHLGGTLLTTNSDGGFVQGVITHRGASSGWAGSGTRRSTSPGSGGMTRGCCITMPGIMTRCWGGSSRRIRWCRGVGRSRLRRTIGSTPPSTESIAARNLAHQSVMPPAPTPQRSSICPRQPQLAVVRHSLLSASCENQGSHRIPTRPGVLHTSACAHQRPAQGQSCS
jgi:YD repeat-containing protein